MVGFDRVCYPLDNWALPYSMLHLDKLGNVYVPADENQFTFSAPLPREWVFVEIEKKVGRREGFGQSTGGRAKSLASPFMTPHRQASGLMMAGAGGVSTGIDIDLAKLSAPTLHHGAGRMELMTMKHQSTPVKVEERVDNEQKLERLDCSVWCLCIQVIEAHHLCDNNDIFGIGEGMGNKGDMWLSHYQAFGDNIATKGDVRQEDFEEGVVIFGNTSKHLFRGSVDALDEMFSNMEPIKFSVMKTERSKPALELSIPSLKRSSSGEVQNRFSISLPPTPEFEKAEALRLLTSAVSVKKSTKRKLSCGALTLTGICQER
jgi:hypothetical protein